MHARYCIWRYAQLFMRCFLSHNKADKAIARNVGANLTLIGIDVWFDEWELQAGDSIPGRLNSGLEGFDAFILLWSANANRSNWVRQELHSAIMRSVKDNTAKIIPCLLDETPLPLLISDRKGIDFTSARERILELAGDLTGTRARKDRLRAIQAAIEELDVEWNLHPMVGPMICCPRCGNEKLEAYDQTDYEHDRRYAGMYCPMCRWSAGGEI
jgi:hypothetical protein